MMTSLNAVQNPAESYVYPGQRNKKSYTLQRVGTKGSREQRNVCGE